MICVADLEADGLYDEATTVWCGVFKELGTDNIWKFRPDQMTEMLSFMDKCDTLIMHNGLQYDWPLLEKLYDYEYKGEKIDTLIMSRLHKPKRTLPLNIPKGGGRIGPHSLEAWGYRVGRGKPAHEDWSQFSPEMMHRCTEDVEITELTYYALLEEGKGQDWKEAYKLTFRLFDILFKQEKYGWLADREYMEKCIGLLSYWIDKIDRIIQPMLPLKLVVEEGKQQGEYKYLKSVFLKSGEYSKYAKDWYEKNNLSSETVPITGPFCRINYRIVDLNSNDETKDYLLAQGWEPEEWNYKKENGRFVLDDQGQRIKTSAKLSHGDPFHGITSGVGRLVARRVQCRHRRSQIEGWLKLIRPDGRVSTPVSNLAETGRATHKGIVNVPGGEAFFGKQMRKCFICKEGFKIVGTDSAGCQNRMLAARVGDDFFTKTLLDGKKEDQTSIHFVNKKAIEAVLHEPITYGQAKALNYAFMFGASDNKLGSILNKNKETGALVRQALLGVAPGFEDLVNKLTEEWRSNAKTTMVKTPWGYRTKYYDGYVTGLDGRPIFIKSEHAILVYVLQSDEAIMMAAAYCMLYKRAEARGWKHGTDWGFLIWYHDEYQCEVREDLCEEFAELAEKCIEDAGKWFNIKCPHQGESDIGINWHETH